MKRSQRRLLNIFAFSLLAFAIYLNFFYKEDADLQKMQSVARTAKTTPASR